MTRTKYIALLTGLASIVYLLVFYAIDRTLLVNPFVYWGTLIVVWIGMACAVSKARQSQGYFIQQRTALKIGYLVYAIAMFFFFAFYFIMLRYVDPELTEAQKVAMEAAGRSTQGLDFSMTLGKAFSGYIISLLGGFLIAYLMALTMKREE